MRRQWSVVLAGLTMVATMAACSKKEENTSATTIDATAAQPAAPAPAPAEATTGAAAAAPAGNVQLPPGVTPEMVAEGRKIFHTTGNCFTCHGPDAKGTPLAPDLTDDKWLNTDGSYDGIVKVITTGVPVPKDKTHPSPMPPKGGSTITDAQVKAVAAYVWSLSHGGTP